MLAKSASGTDLRFSGFRTLVCVLAEILACSVALPAGAGEKDCVMEAADRFGLPVSLLRAIRTVEGGRVGQAVWNDNGTFDVGPMQINSTWAPVLARQGVRFDQLRLHECTNVLVAAWILARELKQSKEEGPAAFWRAIGNYHSHTPRYNGPYAVKVWKVWRREQQRRAGTINITEGDAK